MDLKIEKKVTLAVLAGITLFIGGFMAFVIHDNEEKKVEQAINNGMYFKFHQEGAETVEYGSDIQSKNLVKGYKGELRLPTLDTKTLGIQKLKYVLTYDDLETEYEKTVVVKDTEAPKIKAKKGTEFSIEVGEKLPFSIQDFEASDPVDGKLKVTMENNVNTKKAGEYKVVVWAKDTNNNRSSKTISVIVQEKEEKNVLDYSLGNELDAYEKIDTNTILVRNRKVHIDQGIKKKILEAHVKQFNSCPKFLLSSVDTFKILTKESFDKTLKPSPNVVAHCQDDGDKITVTLSESIDDGILIHECSHGFDFRYKVTDDAKFKEVFEKEKDKFNEQAKVNAHEFFAYTFTSYLMDGYDALVEKCPETAKYYKEMSL